MNIKITTNIPELIVGLELVKKDIQRQFRQLMYELGIYIILDAIRYAPVDSGNLRASALVFGKTDSGARREFLPVQHIAGGWSTYATNYKPNIRKLILSAGYTRAAAEQLLQDADTYVVLGFTAYYALYVHEDLNAMHSTGQAKFLERAVIENKQTLRALFGKRVTGAQSMTRRNLQW